MKKKLNVNNFFMVDGSKHVWSPNVSYLIDCFSIKNNAADTLEVNNEPNLFPKLSLTLINSIQLFIKLRRLVDVV